jgi:lycopene beta-cyclase
MGEGHVDRGQYLILLAACLLVTAPLEVFGARVYRQPVRLARAVLPPAALFAVWDAIAVAAGVWSYDPRYLIGVTLPGGLPLEELVFFLAIPLCALLTYEGVARVLDRLGARGAIRQEARR